MLLPSLLSIASIDLEEDRRHHHPVGVGRGVLDREKEATVLGTRGRLRRLAATVGGSGCCVGEEEKERELVPPPLRIL